LLLLAGLYAGALACKIVDAPPAADPAEVFTPARPRLFAISLACGRWQCGRSSSLTTFTLRKG